MAKWHALAKLRIHTSTTLDLLRLETSRLGDSLRAFADSTQSMEIYETPKEYEARTRNSAAAFAKKLLKGTPGALDDVSPLVSNGGKAGRRRCTFNMETYKTHALGDYARTIMHFGTTDSYSTQIVSNQFVHHFN